MSFFSPVSQARWACSRHNRRGYWSPWLFLILLLCNLGAELLTNDRLLLVQYRSQLYAPVLKDYTERTLDGAFVTTADYRNPWLQHQLSTHGQALWLPVHFGVTTINFASIASFPSLPSASNWLGTNVNGDDVLAWILHGTHISVLFGLLLTLSSSVLKVLIRVAQGYYGSEIDLWSQCFIEVWSGVPTLFLIILLLNVVQSGFWWLPVIIALSGWVTLVGVVRAEFLRTRNYDYIQVAQTLGVSNRQTILRYMLLSAMVTTLTFLPFILRSSTTTLTSLDFLGFGLPLDSPSFGELLLQRKNNLQAPQLGIAVFPSVAVLLTPLIFTGEAAHGTFDSSKAV